MGPGTRTVRKGGTGRVATEGKGVISLLWVFWNFLYDVLVFDFKFGRNRTADSEDIIHFVAVHRPCRTIRFLVVSDIRVSDVSSDKNPKNNEIMK